MVVTAVACALNVLTQLLLEGAIRQPLFGHAQSLAPKIDEDFTVVLLRLGTASLETTSIAGLGNEVGGVRIGNESRVGKRKEKSTNDAMVELDRAGVVSISHTRQGKSRKDGFTNEIKNVKARGGEADWWFDNAHLRELIKFGMILVAIARGIWRLFLRFTWYRWRRPATEPCQPANVGNTDANTDANADTHQGSTFATSGADEDEDGLYHRFLRGEAVSDDEDEYEPSPGSRSESAIDSPYESRQPSDVEDESDEDESGETVNLYTDLFEMNSSASAPLLLAHMTADSASPLTRRRYSQLLSGSRGRTSAVDADGVRIDEWIDFVQDRREAVVRPDQEEYERSESRRNCVVCTVEPREIICWPCRWVFTSFSISYMLIYVSYDFSFRSCLALCDDCRVNLASRFAASKHSCPCCRRRCVCSPTV